MKEPQRVRIEDIPRRRPCAPEGLTKFEQMAWMLQRIRDELQRQSNQLKAMGGKIDE